MLEVPVYNIDGRQTGSVSIDEADLGGRVRPALLKQAIVMYQGNRHVRTVATKGRSEVQGSTRKLYRQKGTGNARVGNNRTPIRRGGGMAFAKKPKTTRQRMPKRMRRLAFRNALLAKITSNDLLILDELPLDIPKTSKLKQALTAVGVTRGCLLALPEPNAEIHKSSRNIPRTDVIPIRDLNAYDVLRRNKVVLTKAAFEQLAAHTSAAGRE